MKARLHNCTCTTSANCATAARARDGIALADANVTMIVATHRPQFVPALCELDKLAKVDLLVVEDELPAAARPPDWRTIEACYADAPYFATYAPALRTALGRPAVMLKLARSWLKIQVPLVAASSLRLTSLGADRVIEICRKADARAYLAGAEESIDAERIGRTGLGVIWQHHEEPPYPDLFALLFYCGDASREVLFDRCHPASLEAA